MDLKRNHICEKPSETTEQRTALAGVCNTWVQRDAQQLISAQLKWTASFVLSLVLGRRVCRAGRDLGRVFGNPWSCRESVTAPLRSPGRRDTGFRSWCSSPSPEGFPAAPWASERQLGGEGLILQAARVWLLVPLFASRVALGTAESLAPPPRRAMRLRFGRARPCPAVASVHTHRHLIAMNTSLPSPVSSHGDRYE